LIHLYEQTGDELSFLIDKMASISGVLLGLAEGYDQLCCNASFGRLGRARKIDFLIQVSRSLTPFRIRPFDNRTIKEVSVS